jgi:hypothetical protein
MRFILQRRLTDGKIHFEEVDQYIFDNKENVCSKEGVEGYYNGNYAIVHAGGKFSISGVWTAKELAYVMRLVGMSGSIEAMAPAVASGFVSTPDYLKIRMRGGKYKIYEVGCKQEEAKAAA